MDAIAARTLGQVEGVRAALIQQLDQRFGDLPEKVLEVLDAADDMNQLQKYLERLCGAKSLDEVI